MDIQSLNDNFAIEDALVFEQHGELIRARVTTPACTAEFYLQGAHLTQWQPAGQKPVLFLSERSLFEPGKPIRGGVPLIFPWFGPRTANELSPRTDGPMHGFARIQNWELAFAAMAGEDLHIALTLGPTEMSRALGFDDFQLAYRLILGKELRMQLTVANRSKEPLHFEEALHTYLLVGDAQQVSIIGLGDTEYLDKTDESRRKTQMESPLILTGQTDRPYLDTVLPVNLDDPVYKRRITVDKSGSKTTVVWNPWSKLSATLPDMADEGWLEMTCIETANALSDAITLAAGEHHTMEAHLFVQEFAVPEPAAV
jgi:glucose-6-phosphate 1-epimerase